MNLLEIKNQIIEYLVKNKTFELADFNKVKVPEELEPVRVSAILESLKDLEENKFVRGLTRTGDSDDKSMWILETPIGYAGQEIKIGLTTATLIATLINRYCEANNLKEDYCNLLDITEGDLQNLCTILLKTLNEDEDDES